MSAVIRAALVAVLGVVTAPALAGEHKVLPVTDPVVAKECGSCHMAFQPAFLPERSWRKIMNGLSSHFGDDASVPAETAARISAYLTANAGTGKLVRGIPASETPERITATPYFRHEHDFSEQRWRDPRVATRSNCPACHQGAEAGWYDDD